MALPGFDPAGYDAQLANKLEQFKSDFAPCGVPEPVVHPSSPLHYRLRAEFRMWHQDDQVHYAMFDSDEPKRPVIIEQFAVACESICAAMPGLTPEKNVTTGKLHRSVGMGARMTAEWNWALSVR